MKRSVSKNERENCLSHFFLIWIQKHECDQLINKPDKFRSDFNRIFKTVGGTQCFFSKELTCNYIIHEHNIVNVSQA